MFQQEEIIGQEGAILDEQLPLDLQLNFMKNLNISVPEHQKQTTNLNHQKQQDQPTFNLESCNSYVGESGYFIAQNKLFYEECNVFDDKPQEDNQLNITELKFQEQKQENKQEKQPTVRQGVENLQIFCIHKQKTKNGSQTKNIPKNYGKQIIKFIQTHQKLLTPILDRYQIGYKDFVKDMKIAKKKMNRIIDLKNLWTEHKYAEPVRIISEHFLRKYSYAWIFNSRIEDIKNPIKYRHRIIEGVHKPQQFNYLKQYS